MESVVLGWLGFRVVSSVHCHCNSTTVSCRAARDLKYKWLFAQVWRVKSRPNLNYASNAAPLRHVCCCCAPERRCDLCFICLRANDGLARGSLSPRDF